MLGFRAKIATVAVTAAVALTSFTPSFAMQMPMAPIASQTVPTQAAPGNVEQVQWRHGGYYRRGWYGGYRGYSGYRHGYRYHDGYWFPLAAFGAGALIGGAIASQPRYYAPAPAPSVGINPRHVDWCESRYRSYRAYDNTFQPNYGPRRQCYSPYF
ncbi:BA14K family protein [Rhizobium sp. P40RR-XXII]|uniref:BA14K family protein n=1 Tax=unclassified Rhizobium TaxID=2613769 RepID=UPI00145687E7|nr:MULTISPECIES: BA14K family protein [unclassified Rhizobium]NLR87102.1 BA14K family protein [Rhizobium sp. P28RR-XV]NLS17877.1 BA14K family protein [Rhizobium sp. P40RR-XXII]